MVFKNALSILLTVLVCCTYTFAADGEKDERCVDCVCCKNETCGPGKYFNEGVCYDGCIDGYRGDRCYRKCTHNCKQCVKDADTCDSCFDGFYLRENKDCKGKCPDECQTCTSDTVCTKCRDDFYNDDNSTDCRYRYCPINCKCKKNVCVECQAGYFGADNACVEMCPSNCATCLSNNLCQSCKAGYYNGYKQDNPNNNDTNNCVHPCRDECTSCFSFNNCTSCKPGTFGQACQQQCSFGCYGTTCDQETGNCICKHNFAGTDCKKCNAGKFGDICEKNCPLFCKDKICDKKLGVCNDCKSETINGHLCDTCKDGWHGDVCNLRCPKNCKSNTCERQSGKCYDCKVYTYGDNCNFTCSKFCNHSLPEESNICERKTGHCLSGCVDGYFGGDCKASCSRKCIDNVCEKHTGKCSKGCNSQFSEPECQSYTDNQAHNDNKHNQVVVTVMGIVIAVLAISVTVFIISFLRARFGKKDTGSRTTSNEMKENRHKNTKAEGNPVYYNYMAKGSDTKSTTEAAMSKYDEINTLQEQEHEYEHISSGV